MKTLRVKIGFALFLIFLMAAIVPRFIFIRVFGEDFESSIAGGPFLAGGVTALIIAILLFTLTINRIIIKRINTIASLTKDVRNGNFDVRLNDRSNDELGELSNNFNHMVESLKKNEYLSRNFVQNFTHEFKTPLSIIQGYADILETNKITLDERDEYLKKISLEVTKLNSMAQSILKLSQLEASPIIHKDSVNLKYLIQEILQSLQLNWEKKSLALNLNLDEINIKTDAKLLYQAIYNIIDNAIKYAYENSTLSIELFKENKFVLLVTNEGPMIKEDDKEKIFNLFYVADKNTQSDSTGIGLSITKKILQLLNYSISYESSKKQTTFKIEY